MGRGQSPSTSGMGQDPVQASRSHLNLMQQTQHQQVQPYQSQPRLPPTHHQNAHTIEIENRIAGLHDSSQRDDVKLKTLKDIWTSIEQVYNLPVYHNVVEKLVKSFLKIFCTTAPQFITENNTRNLRKLVLEIILRMSGVESVKSSSKDIMKQMLRLITLENEENAILAMKIFIDQARNFGKITYCPEISSTMEAFKKILIDLTNLASNGEIFIAKDMAKPFGNYTDEELISDYLKSCFYVQTITLNGTDTKYTLIPLATQSFKMLQEIPMLVVFFYQHYKTSIQSEALEFMKFGFNFLNVRLPKDMKNNINQSLADDFCIAQTKYLSFVNIMGKIQAFMDMIAQHIDQLVTGLLQLLEHCPADLIATRKDVLVAMKYFVSGDLRMKFFPLLPRMLSETALLGTGFTSIENLRVFMYQMLADLLHHMRNQLTYEMLSHISFIFCRQLHDNTTNAQVQIMSARLLNSIAECLVKKEREGEPTRDVLTEVLEALVAKLKVIAYYHLPLLFQQYRNEVEYEYKIPEKISKSDDDIIDIRPRRLSIDSIDELEYNSKLPECNVLPFTPLPEPTKDGKMFNTPDAILTSLSVPNAPPVGLLDGRNLVKFIFQTCKFVAIQMKDTRETMDSYHITRERDLFERLLKYGVMCMDIFVIPVSRHSSSSNRTKDEKETLESLASVFTTIQESIFRELFEKYMDFCLERIFKNFPLQLMINTFLVRHELPSFASIMLSFLMDRMKCLSVSTEKTGLYVKLFKIIFSAIGTQHPNVEGERMLKPFLPDLIRQATVLALSAKEPLNYFLLLRALFRSIGGGAHDILYGKFLPLLPNLLQFLNKLQSGQHRVQMRELFIELCLTVPVRLSSLLPYLPLLMDPLVCALNGSQGLVQQGLRTLELCVDNLQPEFLFEHMVPVRGALMQGLWRVVATSNDPGSTAGAFRILGKFGGANRRMLNEPQMLQFASPAEISQSFVNMEFSRLGLDGKLSIHLPLSDVMKNAVEQMRISSTPNDSISQVGLVAMPVLPSIHLRKQCMELAKSVLLTGLGPPQVMSNKNIKRMIDQIKHIFLKFKINEGTSVVYKCPRENDRLLFINALLVLFYGLVTKDPIRQQYLKFFNAVLRQLALIGLLECAGGEQWIQKADEERTKFLCLDSAVLVDALCTAFSDSNKDFCHSAMVALRHINDICAAALPNPDMMSKIPFCRYLVERIINLCHGPSWFARLGGSSALSYMIEKYPKIFIEEFMEPIAEGFIEVIIGSVDEISSGSVDMAMESIEKLLKAMLIGIDDRNEVERRLDKFVPAFVRHYFHGCPDVRRKIGILLQQCHSIGQVAETFDGFMYRYRDLFVPDVERILNTMPYMSLYDSIGSLAALIDIINVRPRMYEFAQDYDRWRRFITFLVDLAQTESQILLQRPIYKKCENCASHFLPPIPICDQIDNLRCNAIRCIVTIYSLNREAVKERGVANIDSMEIDDNVMELRAEWGLDIDRLTGDHIFDSNRPHSLKKLLTVALRANLNLEIEVISKCSHEILRTLAPLPLSFLNLASKDFLDRVGATLPSHSKLLLDDIHRLDRVFWLNPKILTKTMAVNLTNYVVNWNMEELNNENKENELEEENEQSEETKKVRHLNEVRTIAKIVLILANCNDLETITPQMVIDIVKFAAGFEYIYAQNIINGWTADVTKVISKYPQQVLSFLFSTESLGDQSRKAFMRRIIEYDEAQVLRTVLMENSEWLERILEGKSFDIASDKWVEEPYDEMKTCHRELFALQILNTILRIHPQWYTKPNSPINRLKDLWNDTDFKQRYVVRSPNDDDLKKIVVRFMTEHKFKVPKLIVTCFLRYLRIYYDDFELLFDVITVFIGNFVTDFTFVRTFLENEVIPVMPLMWRRQAFLRIMEKFETNPEKTVTDLRVVKTIQYLIIPSLQWAFERYDVDSIVGESQGSQDGMENDPNNLVSRLAKVVDTHRQKMSDGMVIVFYQLCTLFVQHAPHHIHNNNFKKQGGRLRTFMLFAWPCLTLANHQDPTMRFTGFYFLANIIERFTINRKIVLQVFETLTQTYQQDNRDQVRKAIDILTPAVPIRMDDGHAQILKYVRTVLLDECHNLMHVQHVYQMIIRNYRVYYPVRHELLTPLLNSVQRSLVIPHSFVDAWQSRRLAIEVCEMVIKWDLLRIEKTESQTHVTAEDALEVDKMLETLKGGVFDKEKDDEICSNLIKREKMNNSEYPISKEHIDQIVNMLVRFCVTFTNISMQNGQQMLSVASELIKKCHGLLRAALKPCVWGRIATIRPSGLDKNMIIPPELINSKLEGSGTSATLTTCVNTAQSSLELILNLINTMPKELLLQTLKPLQKGIISCLNSGIQVLVRLVNQLVGKLFEKTKTSQTGLDELEEFNRYIARYLNDQFTLNVKNPQAPVAALFTAFSLVRTICSNQPGYLDAICLNSFLKVAEKAAREHLCYVQNGQDSHREKGVVEMVCISMELIRPRLDFLPTETRKVILLNIASDLIGRSSYEKVVESCLKVVGTLISTTDNDFTLQYSLPLLLKVQEVIKARFRSSKDLYTTFLTYVARAYENTDYRMSEAGSRLWEGFVWGLTSNDSDIREKFLLIWESTWPHLSSIDMLQRMKYILKDQEWSRFGQYYWLRHALWSMLRCVNIKGKQEAAKKEGFKRKLVLMLNCSSPWKTFEFAANLKDVIKEEDEDDTSKPESNEPDPKIKEEILEDDDMEECQTDHEKRLKTLLDEQNALFAEASEFDFAQTIDAVSNFAFAVPTSSGCVANMWMVLFKSFWASLTPEEITDIQPLILPFLSSGTHNTYRSGYERSVLADWLNTMSQVIPLPPKLVQFIAARHECWHTGIVLLEQQAVKIGRQENNQFVMELPIPEENQRDFDVLDSLAALYSELTEFDQYAAVWDKRALTSTTGKVIAAMQLGDTETAQTILENAMTTIADSLALNMNVNGQPATDRHIGPLLDQEYDNWMQMYIDCCADLLQWQNVADVCNNKDMQYSRGLIEAGLHIPDWNVVEECRNQIHGCIPNDFFPEFTVYNTMLTIMKNNDINIDAHKERIKHAVQDCVEAHIAKWRSLPKVVTYSHAKLLQWMNLVREVEEATDLRCAIEVPNCKFEGPLLQDLKVLIKIWRNRSPTVSDGLRFVSTMYDWRLQIHSLVLQRFENWEKMNVNVPSIIPSATTNHSILPIHSAAQGQLTIAKCARQQGFPNLSRDIMNRIACMPTIPMLDSHQKVCDYAKALRVQAAMTKDDIERREVLLETLEVLEDVKIQEMNREQIAKLFYQRANVHSELNQIDLAEKSYSTAAQLVDFKTNQLSPVTVNLMKSWGHHAYKMFFSSPVTEDSALKYGRQALACYFAASRAESEPKARKYISRIMWLAKHLSICGPKSFESLGRIIQNHLLSLNAYNWLYWLPQLVAEINHTPSSPFVSLLIKITPTFPMQVFHAIRNVFPIPLIDVILEKDDEDYQCSDEDAFPEAPPCVRLLRIACRYRPTDIRVFHRILHELDEMPEFWAEKHLRYAIGLKEQLFKDLSSNMDATFNDTMISEDTQTIMKDWIENLNSDLQYYNRFYNFNEKQITNLGKLEVGKGYLRNEENVKRLSFEKEVPRSAQDTPKSDDELLFVKETSSTFIKNLSLSVEAIQPLKFVEIVIAWIKMLKQRIESLPKRVPIEITSTYLSRFTHRVGCVEMPYDLQNVLRVRNHNTPNTPNQSGQYVSMISRFDPHVEIIVRGGQVQRCLNIRAQTGKTASFYLRKYLTPQKTNRVPQLFSHVNTLLQKDRETARRYLYMPSMTQMRASSRTFIYEIAFVQPYFQTVECGMINPVSAYEIIHPIDILAQSFHEMRMTPDDLVYMFFERFAQRSSQVQNPEVPSMIMPDGSGIAQAVPQPMQSYQVKRAIYEEFVRDMVSDRILVDYFTLRYPDKTMYYMMRKKFVQCLAVLSVMESHCSLTPLTLEDMMITANTGVLVNVHYRFELAPKGTRLEMINKNCHDVPFRLTPNLLKFIGMSLDGDLMWCMAAMAKCMSRKEPEIIMRPLLWDEHADNVESDDLIYVCHATNSYVNEILKKLDNTNSSEAKLRRDDIASQLCRARKAENLSRMPPSYHPWM
ncbi:unnamed protein product [Caenorhabditis bovis]|uniref:Non-specific serine/threonine protein kinase n=1 Tax=Caenorhabditis bovis TaxID=2654633 RepID=A0A8S1ES95_9PELO|nr:unnamed protein product [Caenorhabditis bovis]